MAIDARIAPTTSYTGYMHQVSHEQFEALINQALSELPEKYIKRLDNVAIVIGSEPTPEQRQRLNLSANQSLFGLYEGIPLTQRGNNYNLVLPDKITLFKTPLEAAANSHQELAAQVKHTLWHEIAHYFGLSHDRIYKLDGTNNSMHD